MDEEKRTEMGRDAPEGGSASPSPDLSGLLGGLLGGAGGADGQESGISSDAMRSGIGAVLSDPQMMAKLPDMIEMLRPMLGGGTGGAQARQTDDRAPTEKALPAATGQGRRCHDRRVALLRALRPYMNERRQEAIDYILRMDQMGKLFRGG